MSVERVNAMNPKERTWWLKRLREQLAEERKALEAGTKG